MTDGTDTLKLEGVLSIREVAELEHRHRSRFDGQTPPATVSLADVESGDSSALALLLEWQSRAQRAGRRIQFDNPPESLRVIARLTGVAPLLGWSEQDPNANSGEDRS
ncbi:STAS domain-containing protein [Wenzhouxiangella sp. EGI_FJ10305]|uniref:STAS domain-containing protein n=1 Tax=Wenzhouxiangella sp. EGI_FJ10305 TaxID=3243768 RepID=UPI0035DC5419